MLKAAIQKYKNTEYRITPSMTVSLYSQRTQNVLFWSSSPWGHMSFQVHFNPVTTNVWTNHFSFPVESYPACLVFTEQQIFLCPSASLSLTPPNFTLPVLWAYSLFSMVCCSPLTATWLASPKAGHLHQLHLFSHPGIYSPTVIWGDYATHTLALCLHR